MGVDGRSYKPNHSKSIADLLKGTEDDKAEDARKAEDDKAEDAHRAEAEAARKAEDDKAEDARKAGAEREATIARRREERKKKQEAYDKSFATRKRNEATKKLQRKMELDAKTLAMQKALTEPSETEQKMWDDLASMVERMKAFREGDEFGLNCWLRWELHVRETIHELRRLKYWGELDEKLKPLAEAELKVMMEAQENKE